MKYQTKADSLLKSMFQRLAPIAAMVCCTLFLSCRTYHDKVDDEYSRGFFNALAIMQNNFSDVLKKDSNYYKKMPYWIECKKSYLKKQDLYNQWDDAYSRSLK